MSTPFNTTPNFDNLLLQSLMARLQLRQQPSPLHDNHPLLSQSFEDLLLDAATNGGEFSFFDNEEEGDFSDGVGNHRTQFSKEESMLEKELVKIILSGNTQLLKPNSGQAVSVGGHHVCVGFHAENGSDYRVWEWHGHIMLFDDENGFTPEYIYGNYFERVKPKKEKQVVDVDEDEHDDESKPDNLGLKELIESEDSTATRILHQSRNAAFPRVLKGACGN